MFRTRSTRLADCWVFLVYALLAISVTWPLVLHLPDGVAHDRGDPLFTTWLVWWNAFHVPFTTAWWNAPAFFPAEGVMAFSEVLVGLTPITSPIVWVTGNPQLAHNFALLLTFPLSAFFAYLLCGELTGRRDAAFFGGLFFGFTPIRISQLPHIQMLATFWMPLALYGLHRYLRTERVRWVVLFAACWLLQALSNGYMVIFFSLFVGGWLCWFLPWRRRRVVLTVGAAWGAAILLIAPVLLKFRTIQAGFSMRREMTEIIGYSADITSIFAASRDIVAWRSLALFRKAEGEIFPGVAALLLVALALLLSRRLSRAEGTIDGVGRRSVFAFYVLAAIVAWLFSLGPRPQLLGRMALPGGPYSVLLWLPGVASLRVPSRFAIVTALALSAAGAIAFGSIVAAMRRPLRWVFTAAFLALGVADFWTRGTAVTARPAAWPIQFQEAPGPVLEIPLAPLRDIETMYRSMYTGNPTVNGYSGNFPPSYGLLQLALGQHDVTMLSGLARFGVTQIVLDTSADRDRAWQNALASLPGAVLKASDGRHLLYTIPAGDPPPPRRLGPLVPVVNVSVNVNPQILPLMRDGDVSTRWQTGPQRGTEEVVFDLGAPQRLGAIVTNLGPFTTDYPRMLFVEVSTDGAVWTATWSGQTSELTLIAALQDPGRVPLTFDLGDRPARYIRLRQVSQDKTWYWTIAEFSVHAALGSAR